MPTITKINVKDFVFPVKDVRGDKGSSRGKGLAASFGDERESRKELSLETPGLKGSVIFSP